MRSPHVGDVVVFHDPVGRPSNALVTAVWTDTCLNVVMVSGNDAETDSYGRQIERRTSASYGSLMNVHGNYWRWPDEEPNPVAQPLEK